MFIDEQIAKMADLNDEMQEFIIDVAANVAPVYCQGTLQEYKIELAHWDDVLKAMVTV